MEDGGTQRDERLPPACPAVPGSGAPRNGRMLEPPCWSSGTMLAGAFAPVSWAQASVSHLVGQRAVRLRPPMARACAREWDNPGGFPARRFPTVRPLSVITVPPMDLALLPERTL